MWIVKDWGWEGGREEGRNEGAEEGKGKSGEGNNKRREFNYKFSNSTLRWRLCIFDEHYLDLITTGL